MPGKGSPAVYLRVPKELHKKIQQFVQRNQGSDRKGELTYQRFVLDSVRERFGKYERNRKAIAKKRGEKKQGDITPCQEGGVA